MNTWGVSKHRPLFFDFGIEKKDHIFNCWGGVDFRSKNHKKTWKKTPFFCHFFLTFFLKKSGFFTKKWCFFAKNRIFSGVGIDTQMVQSPCVGRQKFPCFWSYSAFDVYTVLTPKSMVFDPPKYGFSSGEIHGFGGRKSMVFGSPKQFFLCCGPIKV